MKKLARILILATFALGSNVASAIVITHGADGIFMDGLGGTTNTSRFVNFDRATYLFNPIYVNSIDVTGEGSGIAHSHGGATPTQALLDVLDGTNWLNVFSSGTLGSQSLSSMFSTPITFAGSTISGIRLTSNIPVGQMFHNVSFSMQYTTSGTPPAAVAEPTGIALLCAGLLGLAVARRRA